MASAYVKYGMQQCLGVAFAELAAWIAKHLRVQSAVLDGEIACVDDAGRPVFRDLLFRRRQCVFIAFDLLFLNGKDLRTLPLIKRKAMLKKLLRRKRSRVLYLDHVEDDGRLLFEQIVKMDLEGIVCKQKDSPYKVTEKPSRYWIKVKNHDTASWKGVKNCLSACEKLHASTSRSTRSFWKKAIDPGSERNYELRCIGVVVVVKSLADTWEKLNLAIHHFCLTTPHAHRSVAWSSSRVSWIGALVLKQK